MLTTEQRGRNLWLKTGWICKSPARKRNTARFHSPVKTSTGKPDSSSREKRACGQSMARSKLDQDGAVRVTGERGDDGRRRQPAPEKDKRAETTILIVKTTRNCKRRRYVFFVYLFYVLKTVKNH